MAFAQHIFKAYDIRGLAASELSSELAYAIGRGYVAYLQHHKIVLKNKYVVVGYDMRPTSLGFAQEVMRGITDAGAQAINIGLTSTPLFNFACTNYPEHAAGVMVTASHNPAEYNGFKFTLGNGLPVPGTDMYEWAEKAKTQTSQLPVVKQLDPLPDYIAKALAIAPAPERKFKIAIDFGNGMGSLTVKKLLEKLPNVEATLLYDDLDGSFPNHEANPLKTETLKDLQKKVVEVGADFGFATDGDADRIGLVDEQGKVVEASFVGLLIGNEVLKSHKHPTMLYDLRSSLTLKEEWERRGAKTAQSKVGHANIKKQMTDVGAAFASELSLHLYFGDAHNIEFPDLALLYLLQILAREQKPLSQLIAPFKKYFHSEELNFKVSDKEGIIKKLEEVYTPQARTVSHLDGLWLQCEWGWFNVRASNTEPLLRLNVEANTQALLDEKLTELGKLIQS